MTIIHPTAVVEDGAKIGEDVTIEPYAVVKGTVTLESGVTVKSYAYIDGHTVIGKGTTIWPSAMIGNKSQDLKFKGEKTYVTIGENCEIREFAIITSSTVEGTRVSIGNNCLIMPGVHIAHNCTVGNHVVMSNNTLLAGHVQVGDHVVIGGMVGVHQFVRIGSHSMIGALSGLRRDVPPYTIGSGHPYVLSGINRIGLQRRQFSFETRNALIKAFRLVYRTKYSFADGLDRVQQEWGYVPEVLHFVDFCREKSKRGIESSYSAFNEDSLTEAEDEQEILIDS
ncbi:MAG: acyl-ACP--UDP-N-acetylglucosamine O-acyltransferase [Victivallaceae bacterium]